MNLNTLAADLSKMDNGASRNVDIVDAKIVLGCLRQKLHQSDSDQCIEILRHILKGHPHIDFELTK